jgi:hypothetical protein
MDGYVCARLAGFFAMLCAVMEEEKFGRMVGRIQKRGGKRWMYGGKEEEGRDLMSYIYSDLICAE